MNELRGCQYLNFQFIFLNLHRLLIIQLPNNILMGTTIRQEAIIISTGHYHQITTMSHSISIKEPFFALHMDDMCGVGLGACMYCFNYAFYNKFFIYYFNSLN